MEDNRLVIFILLFFVAVAIFAMSEHKGKKSADLKIGPKNVSLLERIGAAGSTEMMHYPTNGRMYSLSAPKNPKALDSGKILMPKIGEQAKTLGKAWATAQTGARWTRAEDE